MHIHCFHLSEPVFDLCNRLGNVIHAEISVSEGGLDAAIQSYQNTPSPDLVILETSGAAELTLAALEVLAEHCDANTNLIIINDIDDVVLFDAVLALGVSEFFVGVPDIMALKAKIDALFFAPASFAAHRNSKGVAFIGGHGGSGASMLSHLFAYVSATAYGEATIVADCDLAHGSSTQNFMINDVTSGMAEALLAGADLRSQGLQTLVTPVIDNLGLLAAPRDLTEAYDIPEELITPVMEALFEAARLVVFDVPHQWCAWTQAILSGVDHIVIVSNPTSKALDESGRIYRMLRGVCAETTSIHAVINQQGVKYRHEVSPKFYELHFGTIPVSQFTFEPVLIEQCFKSGMFVSQLAKQLKFNKEVAKLTEVVHDLSLKEARRLLPASDIFSDATAPRAKRTAPSSFKEKLLDMIFEPTS